MKEVKKSVKKLRTDIQSREQGSEQKVTESTQNKKNCVPKVKKYRRFSRDIRFLLQNEASRVLLISAALSLVLGGEAETL